MAAEVTSIEWYLAARGSSLHARRIPLPRSATMRGMMGSAPVFWHLCRAFHEELEEGGDGCQLPVAEVAEFGYSMD
jgi:hypothetical protein